MVSYGMNTGQGWGGGFYWKGGGAQASSGEENYTTPSINSPYLGWQVVCGARTCDGCTIPRSSPCSRWKSKSAKHRSTIAAGPESLGASTTTWVRGKWPIAFVADGPSGACQLSATLDGMSVSQPVNEPSNPTSWHQCPVGGFSQQFDTASVPSGPGQPLTMWARDAAYDYQAGHYNTDTVTKSVNLDNTPVGLSLSRTE